MSGTIPPRATPGALRGELKAFKAGTVPAGWTLTSGPATGVSGYLPNSLLPLSSGLGAGSNVRYATSGGVLYSLYVYSNIYVFERFNEAQGAWEALPVPSVGFTPAGPIGPLIALPSGKLLFASVINSALTAARIYNPATNTWGPAADMPAACAGGGGLLLSNGTAYVCGSAASAYAYSESTNTWAAKAKNPLQTSNTAFHAYALAGSGTVLAVSGTSYYLYDEAADSWGVANTTTAGISVSSTGPIFALDDSLYAVSTASDDAVLTSYSIATSTWSLTTERAARARGQGSDAGRLSDDSVVWFSSDNPRRTIRRSTTAIPAAIVWATKD